MTAPPPTPLLLFRLAGLAGAIFGLAGCSAEIPVEQRVVGGDPERGQQAIVAIGCGVCHSIPGIAGADGVVGPSLEQFGRRQLIAGVMPNRPETLRQWIEDSPSLLSETGMPDLPVTEGQSADIAAYLYTLR